MKTWPVAFAQAHFDEMVEACLTDGPQMLTRDCAEIAVLVSIDAWHRPEISSEPTLKALLLEPSGREELNVPDRRRSGIGQ